MHAPPPPAAAAAMEAAASRAWRKVGRAAAPAPNTYMAPEAFKAVTYNILAPKYSQ
jgi:hypothetical protein